MPVEKALCGLSLWEISQDMYLWETCVICFSERVFKTCLPLREHFVWSVSLGIFSRSVFLGDLCDMFLREGVQGLFASLGGLCVCDLPMEKTCDSGTPK